MSIVSTRTGFLTAAFLAIGLGGCSVLEKEHEPRPCPRTAVLAGGESIVVFRDGPGRDLTDILYEGHFSDLKGTCQYDTEDDGAGHITLDLLVDITAARGPANTSREAPLTYMFTVTDAHKNVLDQLDYTVVAEFPGNQNQARIRRLPVEFDIGTKAGQTGDDFNVYLSFKLTREQLDYNLKRRQAR